jgi:hypothetical protein
MVDPFHTPKVPPTLMINNYKTTTLIWFWGAAVGWSRILGAGRIGLVDFTVGSDYAEHARHYDYSKCVVVEFLSNEIVQGFV